MKKWIDVLFGAAFGFALVRSGATDFEAITAMFRLQDLSIAGLMAVAIGLGAVGIAVMRRTNATTLDGAPITLQPKPMHRGVIGGGLLFGVGWAISGTCPGTAIAQVGELRLGGIATLAGILVGIALYRLITTASPASSTTTSSAPATP